MTDIHILQSTYCSWKRRRRLE